MEIICLHASTRTHTVTYIKQKWQYHVSCMTTHHSQDTESGRMPTSKCMHTENMLNNTNIVDGHSSTSKNKVLLFEAN